jgi:hypothetical protein
VEGRTDLADYQSMGAAIVVPMDPAAEPASSPDRLTSWGARPSPR